MNYSIEQHFFSLIRCNNRLEQSLASASNLVEQDHLSGLLIDLAWEKNRFTLQLREELVTMEGFFHDIITLKRFLGFTEFDTEIVNTSNLDLKILKHTILNSKSSLISYEEVMTIKDLSSRSAVLLKSQHSRIEHGLCLMQRYYHQNSNDDFAKTDLIA